MMPPVWDFFFPIAFLCQAQRLRSPLRDTRRRRRWLWRTQTLMFHIWRRIQCFSDATPPRQVFFLPYRHASWWPLRTRWCERLQRLLSNASFYVSATTQKFRLMIIWRGKNPFQKQKRLFLLMIESNMFPTVDLTGLGHADFWLVPFYHLISPG